MDGKIHTLRGPIEPLLLGNTYAHEHLLWSPPQPYAAEDPDLVLNNVQAAEKELENFVRSGGQSLVEMTTTELQRAPEDLLALSEKSGVNIIAATGYNKSKFSEKFTASKTHTELVREMLEDLTRGMEGTKIRAGVIKAASSRDKMTAGEKKVFQAAAEAHLQTGAPLSTHTEAGTLALEQISLLTSLGVRPERILIGHLDRKLDEDYLLEVAKSGVMLGFDQIGKEKYYPDKERITMIKKLVKAGFQKQILLSGDMARRSSWPAYGFGKGPGLTFILWRFIPWLISSGVPVQTARQILTDNPAAFLAWGK